jgi:hypothetical protein
MGPILVCDPPWSSIGERVGVVVTMEPDVRTDPSLAVTVMIVVNTVGVPIETVEERVFALSLLGVVVGAGGVVVVVAGVVVWLVVDGVVDDEHDA